MAQLTAAPMCPRKHARCSLTQHGYNKDTPGWHKAQSSPAVQRAQTAAPARNAPQLQKRASSGQQLPQPPQPPPPRPPPPLAQAQAQQRLAAAAPAPAAAPLRRCAAAPSPPPARRRTRARRAAGCAARPHSRPRRRRGAQCAGTHASPARARRAVRGAGGSVSDAPRFGRASSRQGYWRATGQAAICCRLPREQMWLALHSNLTTSTAK